MKKLAALFFLSFSVIAAPKDELSQRLQLTDGFSADFSQQLISPEGEMLTEGEGKVCLLYTSPSPRDNRVSRMPSSA